MSLTFIAGNKARISGHFTTGGADADPSSLQLVYSVAGAAAVTIPNGNLTRDSLGHFHYDLDLTGMSGRLHWEWVSGGASPVDVAGSFLIAPGGIFGMVGLEEFREYVAQTGQTVSPGTDDNYLAMALDTAATAIIRNAGRSFEIQGAATTRYYTAPPPTWGFPIYSGWPAVYPFTAVLQYLEPPRLEVSDFFLVNQAIGDITVTDFTTGTVVHPNRAWPYNAAAEGKPYTALEFAAGTILPAGPGQCGVLAKWGWIAIPETIRQAQLLQASRYYKRRLTPLGVSGVNEISGAVLRLREELDVDVAGMIADFRRWVVAG